jgi:hypothetical protein
VSADLFQVIDAIPEEEFLAPFRLEEGFIVAARQILFMQFVVNE